MEGPIMNFFLISSIFWGISAAKISLPYKDLTEPPFDYLKDTYIIHFVIDVVEISDINQQEETWSATMYFQVNWPDPRMGNKTWARAVNSKRFFRKHWYPEFDIYNIEDFETMNNTQSKMFGVQLKEGVFYHTQMIKTKLVCGMNFAKFPFDQHTCQFFINPTFYPGHNVQCHCDYTLSTHRGIWKSLDFAFDFENMTSSEKTACYDPMTSYSKYCCGFKIKLTRTLSRVFLSYYLPSVLFVGSSWVSFIIHPKHVPGRCGLLTSLMMIFHLMIHSTVSGKDIPSSANFNHLDIFLLASFFFIVFSILEYSFVLFLMRNAGHREVKFRATMREISITNRALEAKKKLEPVFYDAERHHSISSENTKEHMATLRGKLEDIKQEDHQEGGLREATGVSIDRIAIKIFPLTYILFISAHLALRSQ